MKALAAIIIILILIWLSYRSINSKANSPKKPNAIDVFLSKVGPTTRHLSAGDYDIFRRDIALSIATGQPFSQFLKTTKFTDMNPLSFWWAQSIYTSGRLTDIVIDNLFYPRIV